MNNRYCKTTLAFLLSALLIFTAPMASLAHSGGTDSSGGHRDNRNVSGLGYYHYHHGMGPHLHPNGVCPYTAKKSNDYVAAQQKLRDLGYYYGAIDGSFGPASKSALKAFQRDYGLAVDGSLGPISKRALGI